MENENKNTTIWVAIAILTLLVLGFIWLGIHSEPSAIIETPITQTFDQSISDGVLTVKYLSTEFGMATSVDQILLEPSVVSPCGAGFGYCFYLSTTTYEKTNFESAGISITKKSELKTDTTCLDTPPNGYDASLLPDARKPQTGFSTSVFKNVGDSGAGHIVNAIVYRLFYAQSATCYELVEKIAKTDSGNYPKGAIQEFTVANEKALMARMENMIDNITVKNGTTGIFP